MYQIVQFAVSHVTHECRLAPDDAVLDGYVSYVAAVSANHADYLAVRIVEQAGARLSQAQIQLLARRLMATLPGLRDVDQAPPGVRRALTRIATLPATSPVTRAHVLPYVESDRLEKSVAEDQPDLDAVRAVLLAGAGLRSRAPGVAAALSAGVRRRPLALACDRPGLTPYLPALLAGTEPTSVEDAVRVVAHHRAEIDDLLTTIGTRHANAFTVAAAAAGVSAAATSRLVLDATPSGWWPEVLLHLARAGSRDALTRLHACLTGGLTVADLDPDVVACWPGPRNAPVTLDPPGTLTLPGAATLLALARAGRRDPREVSATIAEHARQLGPSATDGGLEVGNARMAELVTALVDLPGGERACLALARASRQGRLSDWPALVQPDTVPAALRAPIMLVDPIGTAVTHGLSALLGSEGARVAGAADLVAAVSNRPHRFADLTVLGLEQDREQYGPRYWLAEHLWYLSRDLAPDAADSLLLLLPHLGIDTVQWTRGRDERPCDGSARTIEHAWARRITAFAAAGGPAAFVALAHVDGLGTLEDQLKAALDTVSPAPRPEGPTPPRSPEPPQPRTDDVTS